MIWNTFHEENLQNIPRVSEARGGRWLPGIPHGLGLWHGFDKKGENMDTASSGGTGNTFQEDGGRKLAWGSTREGKNAWIKEYRGSALTLLVRCGLESHDWDLTYVIGTMSWYSCPHGTSLKPTMNTDDLACTAERHWCAYNPMFHHALRLEEYTVVNSKRKAICKGHGSKQQRPPFWHWRLHTDQWMKYNVQCSNLCQAMA